GHIFIADAGASVVREIVPSGTNWIATTVAGKAWNVGGADGTNGGARFYNPFGIAVDSTGILYVADTTNHTIRQVVHSSDNWVVLTISGFAGASGSTDGTNSEARFKNPRGIATGPSGNIYISDSMNSSIRKLARSGTNWVATTIAGLPGNIGASDGTNSDA